MEQEFTISTGWKIFYGIFAAFVAGGALAFFLIVFRRPGELGIVLPVVAILLALATLVGGQIRKKIIISADRVIGTNILQTKELATSDIKGCRIGTKTIVIEPISPSYPKITINNYSDFIDSEDLKKWLQENFKDLDAIDLSEEKSNLLNDSRLGATPEERQAKITGSKRISWSYMAVGMLLGFVCIPFDKKPAVAIILTAYPLLGILIMGLSKGLIKFVSDTKKSVYSFTLLGVLMPAFVLCLSGALGYNIYDYHNAILPSLTLSITMAALIWFTGFNEDMPSVTGQAIAMLLAGGLYGFGCIIKINCQFDNSPQQLVHTAIYNKYKNYNKREHYYLYLNSLKPGGPRKEIEVSEGTYYKYNVGDNIEIEFKSGLLNIPWYYLP